MTHPHQTDSSIPAASSTDDSISLRQIVGWFHTIRSTHQSAAWLRWIVPAVIVLLVFSWAFYLRALPASLPIADEWAQNQVLNHYREQITQQMNRQFPNLPDENKRTYADAEFEKFQRKNADLIKRQMQEAAAGFRSEFQDQTGQTYLLGIDPYYYFRQTRNLLTYGTVGTEVRNGKVWDTYKLAPLGSDIESNLHPYIGVAVHKVVNIFRSMSLMSSFVYVGALISALSIIPAFFIARKLSGNVGGFFAAWVTATNIFFVSRTSGETSDTDAYSVFFPLLIAWIFLEAIEQKDWKKQIALSGLTGFFVGLYAFSWTGWWFIFYFELIVLATLVVYHIAASIRTQTKVGQVLKPLGIIFVTLVLSTAVFASTFAGFKAFDKAVRGPLGFFTIKAVGASKVWPNVLTTVAELNPSSLDAVVGQLGGGMLLVLSVIGLLFTLAHTNSHRNRDMLRLSLLSAAFLVSWFIVMFLKASFESLLLAGLIIWIGGCTLFLLAKDMKAKENIRKIQYVILFGIWLVVTLWSTKNGIRFTLLVVPPLAVGFGLFCGYIYNIMSAPLSRIFDEKRHILRKGSSVALALFLVFVLIGPPLGAYTPPLSYTYSYDQARRAAPSVNDGWWDALTKIKDNSAPNSIITSWWDFGHWFKAIADRPVTFDGGSQNTPQARWVGKLLLTPNESTAFGILRMLDCGGNSAFTLINKTVNDILNSVELVDEIILLNATETARVLKNHGFSAGETEEVLRKTHCQPPDGFVIASDDMIGKAGVWGHFGAWDFTRAAMVLQTRKLQSDSAVPLLEKEFNLSRSLATEIHRQIVSEDPNRWIAPWPGYLGGSNPCTRLNESVQCRLRFDGGDTPLTIDLKTMNATIPVKDGYITPDSITFATQQGIENVQFSGRTTGFAVLLIPRGDTFIAILADPLQAKSMFTQMYFYEGYGLRCFDSFDKRPQVTGGLIYTYKVNWDCQKPSVK